MSYVHWSICGYGMNVCDVLYNLKPEGISLLRATMYTFWEANKPQENEPQENESDNITEYDEFKPITEQEYFNDIQKYFNDTSAFDPSNVKQSLEDMEIAFQNYKENTYPVEGLPAFVCNMFSWLWKINGHDTTIIETVQDYLGDDDCYWLLGTVYPWYQSEFKSQDECKSAIITSMNGLVLEDYIDFHSIEQGG